MRILVSGGTGTAGRFIVENLLSAGHAVTIMGRTRPDDNAFSRSVDFRAGDLEPEKVRRAVDLSLDKYCTVAKILGATITISTSFSVNGELYDNPLS